MWEIEQKYGEMGYQCAIHDGIRLQEVWTNKGIKYNQIFGCTVQIWEIVECVFVGIEIERSS